MQTNMVSIRSLRALREQLLNSYVDIIGAEEFSLLYDINQSKDIYPYWKFDHFDVGMLNDKQCATDFRFTKNDLYPLLDVLNILESRGGYRRRQIRCTTRQKKSHRKYFFTH